VLLHDKVLHETYDSVMNHAIRDTSLKHS